MAAMHTHTMWMMLVLMAVVAVAGDDAQASVAMEALMGQETTGSATANTTSMADSYVTELNKPSVDKRDYRSFTLENGLRVVLATDPEEEKGAACLSVGVGHFSDPEEVPGLAHFLEHMLFMGTEKFPDENEYKSYLSDNGGSSNAYTATCQTVYYFSVLNDALHGALDRFSQFFIAPLFDASCTNREMNAVHNEHAKNVQNDFWREMQLERSSASPKHPLSKFGTGNLETLEEWPKEKGLDIRKVLIDFHEQYYSANIMTLAVVGNQSLDTLEEWVKELFADVRNNKVERPTFPGMMPFEKEQLGTVTKVVPVKDQRTLTMAWQMKDVISLYRSKPQRYVAHLVGHEGPGSLLSLLKAKDWAEELTAGAGSGRNTDFELFKVSIKLTESGMANVRAIASLTLQYIKMLQEAGPQEWIWQELKELGDMDFRFREFGQPVSVAQMLSHRLLDYPAAQVLAAPYLLYEYDAEAIQEMLDVLKAEDVRLTIVSQAFAGQTDKTELWYGTEYSLEPIEAEWMEEWTSLTEVDPALSLPGPNPFIPTDFPVLHEAVPQDKAHKPTLVMETDLVRLWHKVDDIFEQPKATVNVELITPAAYGSPRASVCASLVTRLVKDSLNEFAYDAELAGLRYEVAKTFRGINVGVRGYVHKLPELLDAVLLRFRTLVIEEAQYARVHNVLKREWANFKMTQPYSLALYTNSVALETNRWTIDEYLAVIDRIGLEEVQAFAEKLTRDIKVEALVHGSMSPEHAMDMFELVLNKMQVSPIAESQVPQQRIVQLPQGKTTYVQQAHTNDVDDNSAVEVLFQIGFNDMREKCLLDLLEGLTGKEVFQQLRTVEQLGYLVWSGGRTDDEVHAWRVIVQSSDKDAMYLHARVEAVLPVLHTYLSTMAAEKYEQVRASLIARKLERFKTLKEETAMYWKQIQARTYNFDVYKEQAAIVEAIEQDELVQFFQRITSGKERRVLSSQVFANKWKPLVWDGEMEPLAYLKDMCQAVEALDMLVEHKRKTAHEELVKAALESNEEASEHIEDESKAEYEPLEASRVTVEGVEMLTVGQLVRFKASRPTFPSLI